MAILTRYLIRSHVGPFLFALTAVTGLLFLNSVAQKMETLVGKGLTWDVVGEFLILSLPHTLALTLPMAVLVAVLYTFSELTASNEITAMAAGGIKPTRLLMPLVGIGIILAGGMAIFNDQILPRTNHELKNLMLDISRKSPTFELREQVVNPVRTGNDQARYYLHAARIDPVRNELEEVVIFDLSDQSGRRTTFAERGTMAFSEDRTDLYLTLYDGVVHEISADRPGGFQRLFFDEEIIPMRGVGNLLERNTGESGRSDREMTIEMLAGRAREKRAELATLREDTRTAARDAVLHSLGRAEESEGSLGPSRWRGDQESLARPTRRLRQGDEEGAEDTAGRLQPDEVTRSVAIAARTGSDRKELLVRQANRYMVEINKKYAIAFACIVFVLIGAPLAVRFPRGGVGMVIVASVGIFAVYWIGLIGGEKLADRGLADPFWAMWTPNFIFLAVGLIMTRRMGRVVATSRGGGWDDLTWTMKKGILRVASLTRRGDRGTGAGVAAAGAAAGREG